MEIEPLLRPVGGVAGGIGNSGTLTMNNSTVSGNGNVANTSPASGGGGLASPAGTVTMQNTILARNSFGATAADCTGTIASQGYNLIQTTTACSITGTTTGNVLGVDPLLGPLWNNGGSTFTQVLLPGSPAIDAGNPAAPGNGDTACAATDQRGVARPKDGNGDGSTRCDMGAYEREPVAVATATATATRTASPTPTRTATATRTATSLPTTTPTRTPTTQPPTGPSPQRVYLPLVVILRHASP